MSIAARCTCDRKGSGFGESDGYCPRHSTGKRPILSAHNVERHRNCKAFDLIRARSSVDALEMLCRSHPECAVNVTALREELDAADEQIAQLARALRAEVEPPTFMGEPVSTRGGKGPDHG
jgi:hypothetical protein